jgi:hypothetical protein
LKLLNAHKVEYLLVGGYAVGYHGYPRPTGDLDIWIATHPDNATRVFQVLTAFGFGDAGVTPEDISKSKKVFRMGFAPVRIELQTTLSGVEFYDCYSRGIYDQIEGVPVKVISLDDLKRNKKAAGRLKDLADLDYLT